MTITNDFFNRLEGTWQNRLGDEWQDNWGWNFISQPRLGQAGSSDFSMRHDQMRETIVFRHIGTPRNVGVEGNTGFWNAMAYEISVVTPTGEGIHHEMGHFLLRVQEPENPGDRGETPEKRSGDIIRQASIPRANSMLTSGLLTPGSVVQAANSNLVGFYSAKPRSGDSALQTNIDAKFGQHNADIQTAGGPDMARPLAWLQTIEPDDGTDVDWVFAFRTDQEPSEMASGHRVKSPVGVGNLLSDFWIGRRTHGEEDRHIFQYTQKVDLLFNGMRWPHVAVNTLVKR